MIKVICDLVVYEVNGKEVPVAEQSAQKLRVLSHWNRSSLIVLDVGGKEITVSASDLETAIQNARRTGSHY